MTKSAFRYSGSKVKHSTLLLDLPQYKRIVECYLGSGAFSINKSGPVLGFDINSELVRMWHWLKSVSTRRLLELRQIVEVHKEEKTDVRKIEGISNEERTYIRVNCTGVYTGQLSSWSLYPQHTLPIEKTIECLSRISEFEILCASATEYPPLAKEGDLVFLDPPYLETTGNYKDAEESGIIDKKYNPKDTVNLIEAVTKKLNLPIILTYGSNAEKIFPMFKWEILFTKKVPRIRVGGTIERSEMISYINWTPKKKQNCMF